MDQKTYWDSVSEKKDFTTPFQEDVFSQYVRKDALIADIGCGYGRTLHELSLKGYSRLIGFDFSPEMIRRGRRQFPELDLGVRVPLHNNRRVVARVQHKPRRHEAVDDKIAVDLQV